MFQISPERDNGERANLGRRRVMQRRTLERPTFLRGEEAEGEGDMGEREREASQSVKSFPHKLRKRIRKGKREEKKERWGRKVSSTFLLSPFGDGLEKE